MAFDEVVAFVSVRYRRGTVYCRKSYTVSVLFCENDFSKKEKRYKRTISAGISKSSYRREKKLFKKKISFRLLVVERV